MNNERCSMKRIDDPNWRYVPAAKSHVGFKQRMRRYAEMVRNESPRSDDCSYLGTGDAGMVAAGVAASLG